MKTIERINSLKAKLSKTAKVIAGTFVVSGLLVGGATVLDEVYFSGPAEDQEQKNDEPAQLPSEETSSISDNRSQNVTKSEAYSADAELARTLSDKREAELYHRYGC